MKPPKSIKKNSEPTLTIQWEEGSYTISLNDLREQCPCASCQGEVVLLKKFEPIPQAHLPGRYELSKIAPVGHYAVALHWIDGHNTGIYSWEVLFRLCKNFGKQVNP